MNPPSAITDTDGPSAAADTSPTRPSTNDNDVSASALFGPHPSPIAVDHRIKGETWERAGTAVWCNIWQSIGSCVEESTLDQ